MFIVLVTIHCYNTYEHGSGKITPTIKLLQYQNIVTSNVA